LSRHYLDARNLICPLPVIRTQELVAKLNHQDELEVQCTDPGALSDIPTWCRIHGHQLISAIEQEDEVIIVIKVNALS